MLDALAAERFVFDGELVIEIDGRLAFDALQMRLHLAESRIRKLSAETPASLIVFDMLGAPDGAVVMDRPFQQRRRRWKPSWLKQRSPGGLSSLPPRPTWPWRRLGCAMQAAARRMVWSQKIGHASTRQANG